MSLPSWRESLALCQKKILNKTILFNVSRVDQKTVMDKIIEHLPLTNDEFYIIHELGTNSFSLRHQDGK